MNDAARHRAELEPLYRATTYGVDTPEGWIAIRIGQTRPQIDALLTQHGASCWAYVTAHNPGSQALSREENQRRHAALEEQVRAAGYRYYPGESVGDAGAWPAEGSLFVVGMGEDAAVELAKQYGQAAIVVGELNSEARLAWV